LKFFNKKIITASLIAVSFILIAAFFFVFPQQASAQVSPETASLLRTARIQVLNKPAEPREFTLPFLGGESASLSSYKGKVVFLNFWATWCPPCREEMPSMETLYKRYKDKGLEMLAINLSENTNTVRQFMDNNGYTFPVMMDSDGRVGGAYGIRSIPTTLIIDREGKIVAQVIGSIYWDTPQVLAAFEALLNE